MLPSLLMRFDMSTPDRSTVLQNLDLAAPRHQQPLDLADEEAERGFRIR